MNVIEVILYGAPKSSRHQEVPLTVPAQQLQSSADESSLPSTAFSATSVLQVDDIDTRKLDVKSGIIFTSGSRDFGWGLEIQVPFYGHFTRNDRYQYVFFNTTIEMLFLRLNRSRSSLHTCT